MINFLKQLNTSQNEELPKELHNSVMKTAYTKWARTFFIIPCLLLAINLLFSGWYMWTKVVETETLSVLATLFDGFQLTADFFSDFVSTAFAYLPFEAFFIFAINLLLTMYAIRLGTKL